MQFLHFTYSPNPPKPPPPKGFVKLSLTKALTEKKPAAADGFVTFVNVTW